MPEETLDKDEPSACCDVVVPGLKFGCSPPNGPASGYVGLLLEVCHMLTGIGWQH